MTQYYLKVTFTSANFHTSGFYFIREIDRNCRTLGCHKLAHSGLLKLMIAFN